LRRRIAAERESLLDALYALVPNAPGKPERRQLIALRRSVLRLEFGSGCYCEAPVPREMAAKLSMLRYLARRERALREQFDELWEHQDRRTRRALAAACADEEFRKGLALASPDLHGVLDAHLARDPDRFRARDRKRERALLRYLTRAATKATPFGRFCTVISGVIDPGEHGGFAFAGDISDRRGQLRLNKRMLARIVTFLMGDEECRREIPLGLNRTVRSSGGRYTFLTTVEGREVLQRLPAGHAVTALIEHVRAAGTTTLEGLERWLLSAAPGEDPAVAGAYVNTLLEIGLLRPRLGVADNEAEWAPSIAPLLAGMRSPGAHRIAAALDRIVAEFAGYGDASARERAAARARAASAVAELKDDPGIELTHAREVIAYEDLTAAAHVTLGGAGALAAHAALLAEYARITAPATPLSQGGRSLFHEFCSLYPATVGEVPLLRFYEDHYRQIENREAARANEEKREPEGQNPVSTSRLSAALARIWRDHAGADEIDVPLSVLRESIGGGPSVPQHPWQVSMFAHLLTPANGRDTRLMVLGGRYYAGYGKYLSRFLHLLDPTAHASIRRSNTDPPGMLLAEIGGDADFNANLHPPLTSWLIEYPTADGPGEAVSVLLVTDLVVRANRDAECVELIHVPSGKQVLPLDLGFLSPSLRPPLFSLLSVFGPPARFGLPVPGWPAGYRSGAAEILHRPRITVGSGMVVSRRQWSVPHELVPRRGPRESWASYALRLDDWRSDAGIPGRVFARVVAPRSKADPKSEEQPKQLPRRDARKPQYIDFEAPLLIRLFEHLGPRDGGCTLVLEEQLPGPTDWVSTPDGDHAPELVLQLEVCG
jgi:hypothetical protein